MKDIKTLYLTAKNSKKQRDIDLYTECVQEYFENNPYAYISNLKYIISSSIGLKTLNNFIERHCIPIKSYTAIMECLNDGMKKCKYNLLDDTMYKESINMMESFKQKYSNCFIMYEEFQNDKNESDKYLEGYYKNFPILKKAKVNNKIDLSKMISVFGEACIPDMLIYSDKIGNTNVVLESVSLSLSKVDVKDPRILNQWIIESVKDLSNVNDVIMEIFYDDSLEGKISSLKERNNMVYRESVLNGDDVILEYSDNDIKNIEDLILFKEHQITCFEDSNRILKLQSEIYSLYEAFDSVVVEEDVADSVIPMLPGSNQKTVIKENWLSNTHNKKTGDMPDYIRKNHNLNYGEYDNDSNKPDEPKEEPKLDDFKRTSSDDNKDNHLDKITPYDYSNDDKSDSSEDDKDNKHLSDKEKEDRRLINNYYYYTYNNSNNTNSNSFNRHHNDDHSSNKRVNSDNVTKEYHNKNESTVFTFEMLDNMPLMEMPLLAEEYYDLFNEAAPMVINDNSKEDKNSNKEENMTDEKKESIWNKIKKGLKKILDFLIKLYEDFFPKTDKDFVKLSKKFRSSKGIEEKCNENNKIIQIMQIEIPHVEITRRAISFLIDYIKKDKLPKYNLKMHSIEKPTKVAIYYGAKINKDDPSEYGFYVARNMIFNSAVRKRDFDLSKQKVSNISIPFTAESLLELFGVEIITPIGRANNFTVSYILMATKQKIYQSFDYWKNRKAYQNLIDCINHLNIICKHVYRTMNAAYRSAETILKKAADVKTENAYSWELNIIPSDNMYTEAVGDADDYKPKSDNPIQDTMLDIDRNLAKTQQAVKKKVQGVVNTTRTIVKPFKRTAQWVGNMVARWKDADENSIKERLADPHARSNLFSAIKSAIKYGSLFKAGLLLNPIILYLTLTKKLTKNSKEFRLRNEMIGELKAEKKIIDEKIKDAEREGNNKAKYQLMRFKNELNKKLIRVGGTKEVAEML